MARWISMTMNSLNSWLFSLFWGWIDWHTHWHHLTPGSCALCVASFSFVFPCSPQMGCNFQTAQLGTSFDRYCPFTGNLHPDLHWDVYQDRDIGAWFVCIFFRNWACPTQIFQSVTLPLSAPTSASTSSVSSAEPACQLQVHASLHQNSARNKLSFGKLKWCSIEHGHGHAHCARNENYFRMSYKS